MMSFLKSSHAPWASGCWLLWYCYIVLSCLDRIDCTFLEQQCYQKEEKPSHAISILNKTNETRIMMHHADHLLSNAAEETWRIDSALLSRKVAFSILLERGYDFLSVEFLDSGTFVSHYLLDRTSPRPIGCPHSRQIFHRHHVTCRDRLVTTCSPAHGTDKIKWHCLFYP